MHVAARSILMAAVLCAAVAAGIAEVVKIPLTYSSDLGKFEFSYPGIETDGSYSQLGDSVTVCGKKVASYVKGDGKGGATIGFDCNGDGKVGDDEKKIFSENKRTPQKFTLSLDINGQKRDVVLTVNGISTGYRDYVYVQLIQPRWAMTGKLGNTSLFLMLRGGQNFSITKNTVLFADAHCSEQPKDACGNVSSKPKLYGIPLHKMVAINGKYYNVTVAADGSELTLDEQDAAAFGEIKLTGGLDGWKTLVLATKDVSCDLVNSGVKVLPAGDYRIVLGRYGKWGELMRVYDYGMKSKRKYVIKGDCLNTVKMGQPFVMSFTASVEKDMVNVEKSVYLVGAGGEKYESNEYLQPPIVSIYKGDELVSMAKMEFG